MATLFRLLSIAIPIYGFVSLSVVRADSAEWAAPGSGDWKVNDNWNPPSGYPNAPSDTATFGSAITNPATVAISGSVAAASLSFTNANGYTISGGTIDLYGDITSGGGGAHTISSAIDLMADVAINQGSSGDFTVTGAITGAFQVTKEGSNLLILSGGNTYSGGTVITDGSIQGTLTSIQGDVTGTSNGTLRFDEASSGTYAGNISGGVNVVIESGVETGANVTFSGSNTYTGDTTIESFARLNIPSAENLGSEVLYKLGTLNTKSTFTLPSSGVDITDSVGYFIVDSDTVLTISVVVTGSGNLFMTGGGTLLLAETNTYTGDTFVLGGTVQISSASNLGSDGVGKEILLDNGVIHATESLTWPREVSIASLVASSFGEVNTDAGAVVTIAPFSIADGASGGGILRKSGGGRVVLGGASSTYTGGTVCAGGTLQIAADGALGDAAGTITFSGGALNTTETFTCAREIVMTGAGTLDVDSGTTLTLSSTISDAGALTKSGLGILVLSGTNTYSGETSIAAGKLQVIGTIVSASTVGVSGTLSGTGTVGTTVNNGTVSPGASIGTLTINGNYTQDGGATLVIEIDPDGNADLLDITGAATLAGTFQLNPESGVYITGMSYTVLTAGSISGTFDALVEDNPFSFALSYSNTAVTLTVIQSGTVLPVPIAQLKGNAKEVAKYLFCNELTYTGDLLTVAQNITQAPADQFPEELDQLSPAQFGALPLVGLQNDTRVATTFVEYAEKYSRCRTHTSRIFWAEPIGYYYRQNGQGQIPFRAHTVGTAFGGSKVFANDFTFSGGGAYTHSRLRWKENAGEGSWDTIYACPSFGWVPRNLYLNGLALFAFNFYSIDRDISFPNVSRTAHNTHASFDVLLRLDGGGKFRITGNGLSLQPEFSLSYLNIFENGYIEAGAKSINLEVEQKHTAFIQPRCVLKSVKEWQRDSKCFSPSLSIGWVRNAPILNGSYTARFFRQGTCRPSFTVESFHKATDQLILGAELMISTSHALCLFEYEANIGYNYQVQEGKVRFDWAF